MQPEQSWYVGVNGQQQGPLLTSQIFQMVQARTLPDNAYVFTQGMATWTPIRQVPQFAAAFGGAPMMPPPMPSGPAPADVIDYKINGEELQYIEITLDPGEACVSESGASFTVSIKQSWLENHPLTEFSLRKEAAEWERIGRPYRIELI